MANFKTHISTSTIAGIAYGTTAHFVFGIELSHCFVAGGLCSVAGMLPDLDSASGIPQREMLSFVSVIIPMLMLDRFRALGWTTEYMVFMAALTYVILRFGVGNIFAKYTKHRGMWHSIPAAMIAGMVTFLVCQSPELGIRLFKSWAVVIGFVIHLMLDEIYSVDLGGKSIRIKKSFGTAMKFYSEKNMWANISTYGKLILVAFLIATDNQLMEYLGQAPLDIDFSARDWFFENNETDPTLMR